MKMKNNPLIFSILLMLTSIVGYAQLGDLVKIDYTIIPGSNSDIEYNRTQLSFNYPIKLKKEGTYLFLGLDYSNINLVKEENNPFENGELDDFRILDFNIAYTTPLKNDWRFGIRVTPGFSSNLTARDLGIDDAVFSSDVVFIKDKTNDPNVKKPWRIIVGGSYSENRGFPFPLPFVSYYKKIHPKWSYILGVPRTNLQYHFSKKNRLKLYAEIDGFTVNLQRGIVTEDSTVAESINMSLILNGIQYEYHITKHIQFYARTAYIMSASVNIRDEDRDNISELDNIKQLYLRTGVRFKI